MTDLIEEQQVERQKIALETARASRLPGKGLISLFDDGVFILTAFNPTGDDFAQVIISDDALEAFRDAVAQACKRRGINP